MKIDQLDLKCAVQYSSTFKKKIKKIVKQGKDINRLIEVLLVLGIIVNYLNRRTEMFFFWYNK